MFTSPCSQCAWREVPEPATLSSPGNGGRERRIVPVPTFSPHEWFERVHQKHLNTDQLGEDMHLHLSPIADDRPAQQQFTNPLARHLPACFGRDQYLLLLVRIELCVNASRARRSSSQAQVSPEAFWGKQEVRKLLILW